MLVSSSHDIDYYILRCVLYTSYVISRNTKNIDLPNRAILWRKTSQAYQDIMTGAYNHARLFLRNFIGRKNTFLSSFCFFIYAQNCLSSFIYHLLYCTIEHNHSRYSAI